jgi:hypothetical protein
VPRALLLILGRDIPGLIAVTPASAAAAKFAYAITADLGTVNGIQSAAYAINDNGQRLAGHTARFTVDNATQLVSAPRTYHPGA